MSPARRTSARRRMKRYRAKRTWKTMPERLKRLVFEPPEHMLREWEDQEPTYVYCEEPTLAELESKGVPTEEWPYYVGYMKRMLELYTEYTGETLQLEKDSLIAEYVLRGYDKEVLEQVQEVAENCSEEIYLSCPMVLACLEGDYSSFGVQWKQAHVGSEFYPNQLIRCDEPLDKIFIMDYWNLSPTDRDWETNNE